MSFTNLLTIAMPVFERKDFFIEALESAINQTVKCNIIVVDNNSSHDFFEKACKERKVKYYKNDRNIGLFPNFNRCFELSQTKFVMTLQDDDLISPDYVESFLAALDKYPNIDIFFTNFERNKSIKSVKYSHNHVLPFGFNNNGEKVIEYGIRHKLGFPLIASCIKKSVFTGFYTDFHSSNDWLWIYSNADNLVFYGESRMLYVFRDHEEQDTKKNASNLEISVPYIFEKVLKPKAKTNELKKIASKHAFWSIIRFKSRADKNTINKLLNSDSIYGRYLKNKIEHNKLIKWLFAAPRKMVWFFYKSSGKIGIYD